MPVYADPPLEIQNSFSGQSELHLRTTVRSVIFDFCSRVDLDQDRKLATLSLLSFTLGIVGWKGND